ncbi:MAG TPA: universal stress protein [Solirubrobacteraceae bacterium]|nr:universal stress protein [Solirubrobacteraceae bacterium]
MTGPVILAYDGSSDAKHAVRAAGDLLTGPAVVVYVYPVPQPVPATVPGAGMTLPIELDPSVVEEIEEQARHRASGIVREGLELARQAGFEPEPRLLCGDGVHATWNALVCLADELEARAIVVGHHELSWLHELRGSVTGGVIKHATRPVLVVPVESG